jgi:hypothetical protein
MPILAAPGPELAPGALGALPPPLPSRDPWSASALPPFALARRFLEHVATLTARDWADVVRRAATADAVVRRGAMQQLGELLETRTRRRTCDAILRIAQDAVDAAREHGQLGADVAARAATLASGAAFALVLRDHLPPADFDALYAPFATMGLRPPGSIDGA